MCVCDWWEYRSAVYQATLSFSWEFTKYVSENEGYKLPMPLSSGLDSELLFKLFFYMCYFKGRSYFVYGTFKEIQGSHWLAAMYVVFSKVSLMAFE